MAHTLLASQSELGFDPNKSKVKQDTMQSFLDNPIKPELTCIPGIGPAAVEKLHEEGITTTYQLMAKYLSIKGYIDGELMDIKTHNDAFWFFLKEIGISAHRSAIVKAVAEKATLAFPDLYDPAVYLEDEADF